MPASRSTTTSTTPAPIIRRRNATPNARTNRVKARVGSATYREAAGGHAAGGFYFQQGTLARQLLSTCERVLDASVSYRRRRGYHVPRWRCSRPTGLKTRHYFAASNRRLLRLAGTHDA